MLLHCYRTAAHRMDSRAPVSCKPEAIAKPERPPIAGMARGLAGRCGMRTPTAAMAVCRYQLSSAQGNRSEHVRRERLVDGRGAVGTGSPSGCLGALRISVATCTRSQG